MENLTAYLESGVLEQYVLGELPAPARAAVEAAAQQEPAIGQELAELRAGLEVYAQAQAVAPPAGLRERVLRGALAQIQAQNQAPNLAARPAQPGPAGPDATSATPAVAPTQPPGAASPLRLSPRDEAAPGPAPVGPAETPVRSLYPADVATPARTPRWALAASVALLLSLAGNALLYSRWQASHAELLAVQTQQARFAATTQVVSRELAQTRQTVAVLRDDRYRAVALAGTKAAPFARARVLYNPATQAVYLDVRRLPALPAGRQYQLWALDKGQPVDAGTLAAATAAGQGLQQMKDVARAQAFAMTVEPAGGSEKPTLSTMTVMGAVAGS